MEMISFSPLIIIDGAHNLDGAISLKESLELYFPRRKMILILGVLKDKEPKSLMEVLMKNTKKTLFITPNDPRALKAEELKSWSHVKESSEVVGSMDKAVDMALSLCEEEDLIIAAGSLYTIAEYMKMFRKSLHK
jgi:dihydrofolate synthase/folylpolyglutamate synthase